MRLFCSLGACTFGVAAVTVVPENLESRQEGGSSEGSRRTASSGHAACLQQSDL